MSSTQQIAENTDQVAFFEEVLERSVVGPEHDFPRLTEAWCRATGATWVWLWLRNPYPMTDEWEIREVASRGHRDDYIPSTLHAPAKRTVAEYCCTYNQPELVTDMDNWRKNDLNGEFRVACKQLLHRMGCTSFLTIPFFAPKIDTSKDVPPALEPLKGVFCCHFTEDAPGIVYGHDVLRTMALLSAQTIVSSYQALQREILWRLNVLAEQYLSRVSRRPANVRREYLMEVIKLIRQYLSVGGVSIFYRDNQFHDELSCLASTGLAKRTGEPIPMSDWSQATYGPGNSLTWECYKTAEPIILSEKESASREPQYIEELDGQTAGKNEAVLYPIRSPATTEDSAVAAGVIRCADHRTALLRGKPRPFDPVDLQTIDFIARQIGPVVQDLTIRIHREEAISVTKHDLYGPLAMIRDTAEEMTANVDQNSGGAKVSYYDLIDLKTAALIAGGLVAQLDPDPGEVRSFKPQQILLRGELLERIRHMLSHLARRENDMEIAFAGFQTLPPLWVDSELIERVLVNLLMNAIKYGDRSSRILVRAYEGTKSYRIDVKNSGIGIPQSEADRIFERGYRGRNVGKFGLGLGLYISRAAMRRHGGDLLLTNLRNPTVFTLVLPSQLRFDKPE